jgi:hypothetical protein
MDPNASLAEIRDIIYGAADDDFDRLAELVSKLDGWLSRGGFLPVDWLGKK